MHVYLCHSACVGAPRNPLADGEIINVMIF